MSNHNFQDIPQRFKLFSSTVQVVFDNILMNEKGRYGQSDYSSSRITLSTTHGVNALSEDKIKDTFYHEKVHMILEYMHEYELSANEKFVDQFAKLLRQSDNTSEY